MKPHPRIRKTVKWGGAVMCAILVVVWIGSGWYCCCLPCGFGRTATIDAGAIWLDGAADFFGLQAPTAISRRSMIWQGTPMPYQFIWSFRSDAVLFPGSFDGPFWQHRIPLWAPTALAALFTCAAWVLDQRAHRREHIDKCPKCSYSRTGLAPTAVCPECGTAALAPPSSTS